jgi:hypothetical protein
MTLPIAGSLAYLTGSTVYLKLEVLFDTGGQQITRDSWVIVTPTAINEWDVVSTDPTICRKVVLSGASYPQCTSWSRTPRGLYISECTIAAQGNKVATFDFSVQLSTDNKLVQMVENTTIDGMTDSTLLTMTSQGTTPPIPSDFNLPSSCSAPDGNDQVKNDNSQGMGQLLGTGKIPLRLLWWLP